MVDVVVDGVEGIIVPPANVDRLAEAIRHIDDVRARYVVTFRLGDWVNEHPATYAASLWIIAFTIIAGFALRRQCPLVVDSR